MKCRIITDASFCNKTKLCGLAFSIDVDSIRIDNSYTIAECKDTNEGELFAIQFALLELRDYLINKKISSIDIYTDSQTAISCLSDDEFLIKVNRSNLTKIADDIHETLRELGVDDAFNFVKIKAHVNGYDATDLEHYHNVIDFHARQKLRAIRDPLLYPEKNFNKVCVFNTSNEFLKENLQECKIVLKKLILNNFEIRVPRNESFSFLQNIFPDVYNKNIKIVNEINSLQHLIKTNPEYTNGINRSLMRAYLNQSDVPFDSFLCNVESSIVNAAEKTASLMTGIVNEAHSLLVPSLVIDTIGDSSTESFSYWLQKYSEYLNVEYNTDLKESYKLLKENNKSISLTRL